MIERVSRYYTGPLAQLKDKYQEKYNIYVFRKFNTSTEVSYIEYTYKEGDSLAAIAETYGKGAKYWWEIMEINPEIADPFYIPTGTILRVPYGN